MSSHQARPQLVVFDLGNVLVRIATGWPHACELAGVTPPATAPSPSALAALHDLVVRSDRGQIDIVSFCAEVSPHLGLSLADVRRLCDAYVRGHFPGVPQLLTDLRSAGVRTACLSNTNDNHWDLMSRPPYVLHLLDHRLASHLVGEKKPHARIYDALEQETGHAGGDVLFFDDLAENVAAAQARGWRAELVAVCDDPIPFLRDRLAAHGIL